MKAFDEGINIKVQGYRSTIFLVLEIITMQVRQFGQDKSQVINSDAFQKAKFSARTHLSENYKKLNTEEYTDINVNRGKLWTILDSVLVFKYTFNEYVAAISFAEIEKLQKYIFNFRRNSFVTFFFYGNIKKEDYDILHFLKDFQTKFWKNSKVNEEQLSKPAVIQLVNS